jgi:hypothetical protein
VRPSRHILTLLFLIALIVCISLAESSPSWTPQLKFRIENRSYTETLIFVSGISYALTASNSELKHTGTKNFFCVQDNQIGSKLLIDILNAKHTGNITSEQAIKTVVQGLKKKFPCNQEKRGHSPSPNP